MKDRNGTNTEITSIDQLAVGSSATVVLLGNDSLSLKLMEMGLIPGKTIKVIKRTSYGDPIAIRYGDTTLALRKNEAQKVQVKPIEP
jgi:ferrous iron transport protein A